MSHLLANRLLQVAVAHVLQQAGFDRCQADAVHALVHCAEQYLRGVLRHCGQLSETAGRAQATLLDASVGTVELGVGMREFAAFAQAWLARVPAAADATAFLTASAFPRGDPAPFPAVLGHEGRSKWPAQYVLPDSMRLKSELGGSCGAAAGATPPPSPRRGDAGGPKWGATAAAGLPDMLPPLPQPLQVLPHRQQVEILQRLFVEKDGDRPSDGGEIALAHGDAYSAVVPFSESFLAQGPRFVSAWLSPPHEDNDGDSLLVVGDDSEKALAAATAHCAALGPFTCPTLAPKDMFYSAATAAALVPASSASGGSLFSLSDERPNVWDAVVQALQQQTNHAAPAPAPATGDGRTLDSEPVSASTPFSSGAFASGQFASATVSTPETLSIPPTPAAVVAVESPGVFAAGSPFAGVPAALPQPPPIAVATTVRAAPPVRIKMNLQSLLRPSSPAVATATSAGPSPLVTPVVPLSVAPAVAPEVAPAQATTPVAQTSPMAQEPRKIVKKLKLSLGAKAIQSARAAAAAASGEDVAQPPATASPGPPPGPTAPAAP